MIDTVWNGCYDDSWKDLITPDSFGHPAKMARGLLSRIVAHGFEQGWWKIGDVIGDAFGGVGTTGIIGAYHGLQVISVELEPRFVGWAAENYALHRRKWEGLNCPLPVLVQGDSRQFARIVGEIAGAMTSPPFGLQEAATGDRSSVNVRRDMKIGRSSISGNYGDTTGNIGNLPAGKLDAALQSPPFTTDQPCASQSRLEGNIQGPAKREAGMASPGNIQTLPTGTLAASITSPPYAESVKGDHVEKETAEESHAARSDPGAGGSLGKSQRFGGYGAAPGNIGNLKEGALDGVATSPPWEGCGATLNVEGNCRQVTAERADRISEKVYGTSRGQVGSLESETYWTAMRAVYAQILLALKPGGIACVVLKDYIKGGKRVPLCDQSLALLLSLGFQPVERIRAMLVKETTVEGLHGPITTIKERKSFFRRLHEKKLPAVSDLRIDWEEVLVVRKPL